MHVLLPIALPRNNLLFTKCYRVHDDLLLVAIGDDRNVIAVFESCIRVDGDHWHALQSEIYLMGVFLINQNTYTKTIER